MERITHGTHAVASMAGVHRDTLLRWLREGRIPEPHRDRNNWRAFTSEEAQAVVHYAKGMEQQTFNTIAEERSGYRTDLPFNEAVARLPSLDWDFATANTGYLTHPVHPYPCKFIPQIPNTLIQELSSVGETVLDPFSGSGTTLVEALRLGRNAIGIDANPLACLISRAKTVRITEGEAELLQTLAVDISTAGLATSMGTLPMFPDMPPLCSSATCTVFKGATDWFDQHVIDELAFIKSKCLALEPPNARHIALAAFSSIIVAVSRQDSETRYVRTKKALKPGDTLQRFVRALSQASQRSAEFTQEVDARLTANVHEADILAGPDVGKVDLVVCSPPYPNAFSYHLYHRTRMLWLDMDQPRFKKEEIGSHRKYSRKGSNAATVDTFRSELHSILRWLTLHLNRNRHACIIIGDSILQGKTIPNDELLIDIATKVGFQLETAMRRRLQDTKKYFNPTIGKIKHEHIIILRNTRKGSLEEC